MRLDPPVVCVFKSAAAAAGTHTHTHTHTHTRRVVAKSGSAPERATRRFVVAAAIAPALSVCVVCVRKNGNNESFSQVTPLFSLFLSRTQRTERGEGKEGTKKG